MARDVEELVVWQLATELKRNVYELIRTGPIARDREITDHLKRAAASAPRLIAEGFGRYLPGDFTRYLRQANGELKEVSEALSDAVDRGFLTQDRIIPLRRLSKRTSKALSGLIRYLRTAEPPNEPRGRRKRPAAAEPPEP